MAERIDPAANVYARALHGAAVDAGRVAEVDANLRQFSEALASNVPVLRALINPELPAEAKKRIISRMMDSAEPIARNGLLLLVDNRRLELLHDLQVAYAALAAVDEKILDIEVTTAIALDDARTSRDRAADLGRCRADGPRQRLGRSRHHRRAGTCAPAASSWMPPFGAACRSCGAPLYIPPFQLGVKRESASGRDCCNPQNRDRALRGFGRGRGGRDGHSDRRRYRPHLRP